ncbi:hypothetical protein [Streptomyces sp. NPDC053560]|uniref:hypothetical protein n=1 Tax=Streptomyces sp. NPDC053560 TaxID=3365711 RepID=UPI0037CCE588
MSGAAMRDAMRALSWLVRAVRGWGPSPVGTRRAWRRRAELQLRVSGQYGPEWWEIAPAAAAILAGLGGLLAGLVWLWLHVGWWAALFAAAVLACVGRAAVRWHRARVERRRRSAVCFSLEQVDAADDRAFRAIVGRLLLRDGWTQVRGVRISRTVVHLVGAGRDGRRLGVAFERGVGHTDRAAGGRAVLRPVGDASRLPGGVEAGPRPLFLVVSSGAFARERVVWAARNDVRLVDRALLQRWAAGEPLALLLDLDLTEAYPNAS